MKKRFFELECFEVNAKIIHGGEERRISFCRTARSNDVNPGKRMVSFIAYEIGEEDTRKITVVDGEMRRKIIRVDVLLEECMTTTREVVYKC